MRTSTLTAVFLSTLAALPLVSLSPPARAQDPQATPPRCDGPESERAPDPRCGEPLDGRAPEGPPSAGVQAGRAALWVPKQVGKAVVWPIVKGTDFLEAHDVPGWYKSLLTSDDGLVGIRPILNIRTGLLPSVGARFFYRRLPGEGSEAAATFETAGPAVILGQLEWRGPTRTGLAAFATFDHRNDRVFAGIGPNSESTLEAQGQDVSRYGSNILRADLGWVGTLPAYMRAIAHTDVARTTYESDNVRGGPSVTETFGLPAADCMTLGVAAPCVNPAQMPGFYSGVRMVHAGAGIGLDTRTHLRSGGSGVSALIDATGGWGISGDPTRDVRVTGEAIAAIAGTDRVLMIRGWAQTVEALNGTVIPFDELVSPAGALGMRGFPNGRFRGQSGVVGTIEYRYYIAWDLDASIFSDVGTVAGPQFTNLGSSQWFPDFGLGLRFYNPVGRHWETPTGSGMQITYAPDGGFRFLLSLAGF